MTKEEQDHLVYINDKYNRICLAVKEWMNDNDSNKDLALINVVVDITLNEVEE